MQISTFPFAAFGNVIPNVVRRRNDGFSPIVTSAIAPERMKTRRSM